MRVAPLPGSLLAIRFLSPHWPASTGRRFLSLGRCKVPGASPGLSEFPLQLATVDLLSAAGLDALSL